MGSLPGVDGISLKANSRLSTRQQRVQGKTSLIRLILEPAFLPDNKLISETEPQSSFCSGRTLRFTYQEIPHAVAVVIEEFKARSETLTYIAANVFVERESQKGIIIGKKGAMLHKIGAAARAQIERLTGTKVYLDLWVKVSEGWRKDDRQLRRLGYG